MNRDFKGIWIPKEIWLVPGLSKMSVILWAEIHSLYSPKHGGCYASNDYLCEFIGVKERQLQKYLRELKDAGLLEQKAFNGRFRILLALVPPHEYEEIEEEFENSECGADPHYSAGQGCTKVRGRPVESCAPSIYKNKEDNKDKEYAQTRKSSSSPNADFSFSSSDKKFIGITDKDLADWKEAYPYADIPKELKKAEQWLLSNPSRARKKNWRKFVTQWLSKASDQAENKAAYRGSKSTTGRQGKLVIEGDSKSDGWKRKKATDVL